MGIGTDTPSAKLEVGGGIKGTSADFSSAITAPSATIPSLSGNVAIGGTL